MNIYNYLHKRLPEYFFNGKNLEKLLYSLTFPYDILLQAYDYIPRLRDPKQVAEKDLYLLGYDKNLQQLFSESNYKERLPRAFEIWEVAGSRFGLSTALEMCGYITDPTVYEYGIEERVQVELLEDGYAIWATEEEKEKNRGLMWGHFVWPERSDGYSEMDSYFSFSLHIKDEDDLIYTNENKIISIRNLVNKLQPAHTELKLIHLTDGNGVIKHSV